jgi:SRSO17 transposase
MPDEGIEPTDLCGEMPGVLMLTPADVNGVLEELACYHAQFAPLFKRSEQRQWAQAYLRGLLTADVARKNVEAMVLRLYGAGPHADRRVRALQQFIGESPWDDEAILAKHQSLVAESLGEEDGVFIIDGSDFAKQGKHSAGVARQWCGATGKKDNCQAGVFLGYASRKGYTLLDRRLYLPESWFGEDHRALWQACRIPEGTPFRSKHELAAELIEQVMQGQRLGGRWVVCDEGYGDAPALLDCMAKRGLWYLAEVPKATKVWPLPTRVARGEVEPDGSTQREGPETYVPERQPSHKGPVPVRAKLVPGSASRVRLDEWAEQVPAEARRRYRMLEGSKGPLVADFVALRAVAGRDKLPGPEVWVLLRYKVNGDEALPEVKYYLSNAPANTAIEELVRVCGMRWPIESSFEEGKGELGMDQYELRFWAGWHHHMTLVILAHHFLVRLQEQLRQREGGQEAGGRVPGGLSAASHGRYSRAEPAGADGTGTAAHGADQAELGRGAHAATGSAAATGVRPRGGVGALALPAAPQGRLLPLAPQTTAPLPE